MIKFFILSVVLLLIWFFVGIFNFVSNAIFYSVYFAYAIGLYVGYINRKEEQEMEK